MHARLPLHHDIVLLRLQIPILSQLRLEICDLAILILQLALQVDLDPLELLHAIVERACPGLTLANRVRHTALLVHQRGDLHGLLLVFSRELLGVLQEELGRLNQLFHVFLLVMDFFHGHLNLILKRKVILHEPARIG